MEFIKKNKNRITLFFILLFSAFLNFWGTWNEGWSNAYYSIGVRSMLESWKNFFFAAYDSAGFVSIDKPALGLWIQSLFAMIFGFNGWAMILPQSIASVISVLLLYKMLKKPFGEKTALTASLMLAVTPVFVAVSRTNNLDATMILAVIMAAYFLLKTLNTKKFGYMIISMIILGLGYNIKMIQAFMILPSIYICYWIFTKYKPGKRLVRLIISTVVLIIVSISWCIAVDLTPKDSRPYVGSSSNNSAMDLAVGYNGIIRMIPGIIMNKNFETAKPFSNPESNQGDYHQESNSGSNPENNYLNDNMKKNAGNNLSGSGMNMQSPGQDAPKGFTRLLKNEYGGQIGWFLPFGIIGIISMIINRRKLLENIEKKHAAVFLGSAFMIIYLYFCFGGIVHSYYTAILSPFLASVSAIGLNIMIEFYNDKKLSIKTWLLPFVVFLCGITQFAILIRYSSWNGLLPWAIFIICLFLSVLLVMIKITKKQNKNYISQALVYLFLSTAITSPLIWSFTPIVYGSNSNLPIAGPELSITLEIKTENKIEDIISENSPILDFMENNYSGEKFLMAMPSGMMASMMALGTDKPVMAVGGFNGMDKILTVESLEKLVLKEELRFYVIINNEMMIGPSGNNSIYLINSNNDLNEWVKISGRKIFTNEWLDPSYSEYFEKNILKQIDSFIEIYDLKNNSYKRE